jgi:trigger factor
MNIVVEKLPKCVANLRVEIPSEKITGERNRIVAGYSTHARIPGFRPGKAPRAVVEKRFQKEITEELESTLVREAYDEAMRRDSLKVLDFGTPEQLTFQPDGTLTFHATLMLAPEVTLPEYKGIPVRIPSAEVKEEAVDQQIDGIRERFSNFKDIEGRPAAKGDIAVIDFTTTLDGKSIQEAIGKSVGYLDGREGFWLKLDDSSFLPGFASGAEGMNPGDSREIKVTIPADFPAAELCEREIVFSTTLKELKEQTLPEADDEFAARVVPGKTLAELRELIRERIGHETRRKIDDMKVNQIVAFLDSHVNADLPDALVAEETQNQADAMVEQGIKSGMSEEEIQAQQAGLFDAASEQARTNIKTNFILQEIARTEKLTVTEQELIRHIAATAQSRKQPIKKFIKELQKADRIPGIRNSILSGKTIDFLVQHATVEEITEEATTASHE